MFRKSASAAATDVTNEPRSGTFPNALAKFPVPATSAIVFGPETPPVHSAWIVIDRGRPRGHQRGADAMATVTVSNQIGMPVHRVFQFFGHDLADLKTSLEQQQP